MADTASYIASPSQVTRGLFKHAQEADFQPVRCAEQLAGPVYIRNLASRKIFVAEFIASPVSLVLNLSKYNIISVYRPIARSAFCLPWSLTRSKDAGALGKKSSSSLVFQYLALALAL